MLLVPRLLRCGFIINSGWNGAIPSAALNVVWLGIGLYALFIRHRRMTTA